MTSLAYGALWLFVFSLPWEAVISIGGVAVASRVTGTLALAVVVVTVTITGRFRRLHPFHVAALLFVIWAAIDLLVFHASDRLPKKFYTYVQLALVLWMIWELAPSWGRQLGLLTAYVFGAYVAAFDTILLYRREAGALRRFAAGNADPNDLAMTLALALPMAWYIGLSTRQPLLRWICRAYLPVGVVAIGLTGSRGGLIVTLLALLVVPFTMARLTPGRLILAIVVLVGSGALAASYVPDTIVKRLATTGTEMEDARFGGRLKLWKAGFHAFEQRPFMGHGTAGFIGAISPELGSMSQVAHNTYLSVLVEQGIVGLILYLLMFLAVFRAVLRLPRLERRFALILLATLALAIAPLTWEDRKPVWYILAALLGLSQAWVTGDGVTRPVSPPRITAAPGPRPVARQGAPLTARGADRDPMA
jgi:O-antigen ligase